MANDVEKLKKDLLTQLEEFYKNDEDVEEASIFTAEELGAPMDMLRVLITEYGPGLIEVLGEFSFIPFKDSEVLYFSSVLTIMTNVPKDGASALSGAISRLNYYLPYGGFALSPDGSTLVYKSVSALRADHTAKKLYEDIELASDMSLLIPEGYTDLLMRVAVGDLLLDDFIATLPE